MILCFHIFFTVLVRLVNGSTPFEGRVELYYQCQWGTVNDPDWTIQDADVICRQLGYPSAAEALPNAHFGEGSGVNILGNVICDGDESRIEDCDRGNFFRDYYGYFEYNHYYDVGVRCNIQDPSPGEFIKHLSELRN